MKKYLKLPIALLIVTFIAGFVLSYANKKTAPRIKKLQEQKEEKARKDVLPGADKFQAEKLNVNSTYIDNTYWKAYDNQNNLIGYVAQVLKSGYSSTIKIMVGVDLDKNIEAIKILEQAETPGLGAKCEENWFQKQFNNLKAGNIEVMKKEIPDGRNAIKAITAATITSQAVTDGINKGINVLFQNVKKGDM